MSRRGLVVVALAVAVLAFVMLYSMRPPGSREAQGLVSTGELAVRDTSREEALTVRLYFASPGGDSA